MASAQPTRPHGQAGQFSWHSPALDAPEVKSWLPDFCASGLEYVLWRHLKSLRPGSAEGGEWSSVPDPPNKNVAQAPAGSEQVGQLPGQRPQETSQGAGASSESSGCG